MPKPTTRRPSETPLIIDADPFPNGQTKTYREQFPVGGEGYKSLRLTFHHDITIGTGTSPYEKGGLLAVKDITFKTSKNEEPISTPALGLHYFNKLFTGVEPVYDPILAVDGVYDQIIDLPFAMPFLTRQEDTILDTKRYSHLEMKISLGGLADMFATPGDATLQTTLDIALLRSKTCMDPEGWGDPHFLPYIKHYPRFRADTIGYLDIERATDLILFGFFAVAHDLAAWGTEGVAFTGDPADCLDHITWKNSVLPFVDKQKLGWFKNERAQMSNDREFTGMYPHLFTRGGSYKNAFYCGGQTEIKFIIDTILGSPTTPEVDLVIFGARTLRP